jgi:hypothetical protein
MSEVFIVCHSASLGAVAWEDWEGYTRKIISAEMYNSRDLLYIGECLIDGYQYGGFIGGIPRSC